ncbi:MAG: DUF4160 domain-containing protein [Dehalococcoidales bacterium]|nr:DUF4160 domain-containing protein [Dehalococcoidales bacterium]
MNTRENDFEPPHVHVWAGNEDICRIELNGGQFMDDPPLGDYRSIMEAYHKHAEAVRREWDRIHKR